MINLVSSSRYKMDRNRLKKVTGEFMIDKGLASNVIVNLIFVGKNKMKNLSKTYKKENEALPILAFSYNDEKQENEELLGEIVVCYPQAVLLAAERNKKVEDTIITLIKHGIDNLLR